MNKQVLYDFLVGLDRPRGVNIKSAFLKSKPKTFARVRELIGNFTMQELFDFLQPNANRVCGTCGISTRFELFGVGYKRYCSLKCSNSNPHVKLLKEQTCVRNLGVANPSQTESVKRKKITTCRLNFGTDHPLQSGVVRATMRENELIRSGGLYEDPAQRPERNIRYVSTVQERYGVNNVSSVSSVKQKRRDTNLRNWGVPNVMQNAEVFTRSMTTGFKRRKVEINGRFFHLQGYEPSATRLLVKLGIPVGEISEKAQGIPYGDGRMYFPDLRINRLCVEVKSEYTAGLVGSVEVSQNIKDKCAGVRLRGCDFLLMVMSHRGRLVYWAFNNTILRKGSKNMWAAINK